MAQAGPQSWHYGGARPTLAGAGASRPVYVHIPIYINIICDYIHDYIYICLVGIYIYVIYIYVSTDIYMYPSTCIYTCGTHTQSIYTDVYLYKLMHYYIYIT